MVLDPGRGTIAHEPFTAFPEQLRRGDVLVVNETRVVRARLSGTREPGGGRAEILLLHPAGSARFDPLARRWLALVKPGRKLRAGARVRFGQDAACRIDAAFADGTREVELELDPDLPFEEFLERYGELPLPPYVGPGDAARASRYQTIFAREPGSVAAPTASLHFTPAVLERIRERDVEIVPLVLDVGLGTFKPIESERIDDHAMHRERYAIPVPTADAVNRAKREGRRVVVAGTTALRALESAAVAGEVVAGEGESELFITPGFRFQVAAALLTNFHLPGSSLLVLVSAFAGYDFARAAYAEAIAERYRFYSFGDAMFIENRAE
jgi:S-adenosylmethionine:tRNA ribosyltransferase-isomerase